MLQPIHPEADTLLRSAATLMLLSVIGLFFFAPPRFRRIAGGCFIF